MVAATGFGKTTIFEVANSYVVAEDPGDTLMVGQTEAMVADWVKSRMRKVWSLSPCTADLLPEGRERHSLTNFSVIFRHMNWFAGAANETTLQEKSMRYCFGDEPWQWGPTGGGGGMIGYLLKRHHDRWNRKAMLQSQGGTEGTEWHEFARLGRWMEFRHRCPECGELQPFVWDMMHYDTLRDANDELDWPAIYDSVRLRCQHCGREFDDTESNRRAWCQGKWEWTGNRHIPGRVTFCAPFLTVWRISWCQVVREWLLAQESKRSGDLSPLKQFINQRLAQFWVVPSDVPSLTITGDPYRKKEYHDGERWDEEHFRFLTVDVQKGHFWAAVRAWAMGGASRLLWEGRVETWDQLRYLQERYKVESRCVFVDGRYDTHAVARECAWQRKDVADPPWNLLMGEDSDGYMTTVGNRRYVRVYSNYVRGETADRVPYKVIKFSNLLAKNKLAGLMAGDSFGLPLDVSKTYQAQMQSERKVETKPGRWRWEPVKKSHPNNHLWDAEVMQVVAASLFKVLESAAAAD